VSYEAFLASKTPIVPPAGFAPSMPLHDALFPFQRELVTWAIRRGRAALFADTGLGKTRMQLEWARHVATHGRVLILAPLAVGAQTESEARAMGIDARHVREPSDGAVLITNYERLHRFDVSSFAGVVLDESSIIKHHDAKTLGQLLEAFARTPYRLACTATPSPNDYTELGTHAEFLGVCSRTEMLAEYFCHDGGETQTWRLKGHARTEFWRWVASWAALVRKPSDLGHDDAAYELPELRVTEHVLAAAEEQAKHQGRLFVEPASTLSERRSARKASLEARVAACVDAVRREPNEKWVVWCDLNAEQDALEDAFGDECFSVYGSLDSDEKERRLVSFVRGERRILLGKPSIFGFGLNLQLAARMAFVGITDSWEAYYQAVRRCWRFGQKRPVHVHLFVSELEGAVLANLRRKEADAKRMADELSQETKAMVQASVLGAVKTRNPYLARTRIEVPAWLERNKEAL
jgi:superfamily II DNA or RNA helicase